MSDLLETTIEAHGGLERWKWSWCYVDEIALLIPVVRGETRLPPSPLGG